MIGAWHSKYRLHDDPYPMGREDTYVEAIRFLDIPNVVLEDWGGGMGYAGKFVKNALYYPVDGSYGVQADLRTWTSDVGCILLRHVLEHNPDWPVILRNAVSSFYYRMAIVTFTPFASKTTFYSEAVKPEWDVYRLGLPELLSILSGCEVWIQTYGPEHIVFVEKNR